MYTCLDLSCTLTKIVKRVFIITFFRNFYIPISQVVKAIKMYFFRVFNLVLNPC